MMNSLFSIIFLVFYTNSIFADEVSGYAPQETAIESQAQQCGDNQMAADWLPTPLVENGGACVSLQALPEDVRLEISDMQLLKNEVLQEDETRLVDLLVVKHQGEELAFDQKFTLKEKNSLEAIFNIPSEIRFDYTYKSEILSPVMSLLSSNLYFGEAFFPIGETAVGQYLEELVGQSAVAYVSYSDRKTLQNIEIKHYVFFSEKQWVYVQFLSAVE